MSSNNGKSNTNTSLYKKPTRKRRNKKSVYKKKKNNYPQRHKSKASTKQQCNDDPTKKASSSSSTEEDSQQISQELAVAKTCMSLEATEYELTGIKSQKSQDLGVKSNSGYSVQEIPSENIIDKIAVKPIEPREKRLESRSALI